MKNMCKIKLQNLPSLCGFSLLFISAIFFSTSTLAETLVSTTKGLNLKTVTLKLKVPHQHYDHLFSRAKKHFQENGLRLNEDGGAKVDGPILKLTLKLKSLPGNNAGQFLFFRKLELYEKVISARIPKVQTWSTTWTYGLPDPIVIGSNKSVQELEIDLDNLIGSFIQDYQFANQ